MKKKVLIIAIALVLTISALSLAGCDLFFGSNDETQRYFVDIGQIEDSGVASVVANNVVGSCVRICADYKTGIKSRSTGFFVTEDGYIITNRHSVVLFTNGKDLPTHNNTRVDCDLSIITADGDTYKAELISFSTTADIALIKVKPSTVDYLLGTKTTFSPVTFDTVNLPYYGDTVYTMGNPENLGFIFSKLMVACPAAKLNESDDFSTILLDGNINHGNSGGPLIDVNSRVVGIIYARVEGASSDTYGIGCAITANEITDFLDENKIVYSSYTPPTEEAA
ncbi:MAG: serine protease [Clostridia bacterium]|nr:serine protease [Clostridia bacterium]